MVVKSTDIAIIGGGIQGTFLAYYAKRKYPDKTISLYESQILGCGITSYAAHLHIPYGQGEKYGLTIESMALFSELMQEYIDFPLLEIDLRFLCKKDTAHFHTMNVTSKELIFDPFTYPFGDLPKDCLTISGLPGYVSKRNLVNYLMEMLIRMGVKVYEGVIIGNVKRIENKFSLMLQTGETIFAAAVFNATGKAIIRQLEVYGQHLRTKKVVALHIDTPASTDDPVYYFLDEDAFLLPQPYYGRYLFSFRSDMWDIDDNAPISITREDLEIGKKLLHTYGKPLSGRILGGQAYLDVYNKPSSSPLIYEVENNFYVVGATGGSGIRLAPAIAIKALNKVVL